MPTGRSDDGLVVVVRSVSTQRSLTLLPGRIGSRGRRTSSRFQRVHVIIPSIPPERIDRRKIIGFAP